MSPERKRDIDAAVQRVIDQVTARREDLSAGEIRTALASGLASVGVWLPYETLQSWTTAIADGETIRAEIDYR